MANIPRLLVIGLLAQLGFSSLYALDLEDRFELKGRPEGTPLGSSNAGDSQVKWIASSNLKLSKVYGTSCVVFSDPGAGFAKVPVEEGAKVISVAARLWPRSVESGKNTWMAIGLGNPIGTRKDITWANGLLLLINTAGYFEFFVSDADSKLTKLANGKVSDYRPDDFNEVRLDYRRKDNTLDIYVNGTRVPQQIDLAEKASMVDPAWAGFSGFGQPSNQPTVANFVLKTGK